MLTRRDLVSSGLPVPPFPPRSPSPPLFLISSSVFLLLSCSDPQALNDFLHGSEKVSAGRDEASPRAAGSGESSARHTHIE